MIYRIKVRYTERVLDSFGEDSNIEFYSVRFNVDEEELPSEWEETIKKCILNVKAEKRAWAMRDMDSEDKCIRWRKESVEVIEGPDVEEEEDDPCDFVFEMSWIPC